MFYSSDALPPNGLNEDFYVNKNVTDIINQAEQEIDPAKAKPLFWKAQEMLAQDLHSALPFDDLRAISAGPQGSV